MQYKLRIVSNNIKRRRLKSGVSEEKIAKKLGISIAKYLQYESNPKDLNMEFLEIIAVILHCDVADFFIETKDTFSDKKDEERQ